MKMLVTTLLALTSSAVMADTVLMVRSGDSGEERVSIKGDWARMDGASGDQGYMLGNLSSGVMYVVMPDEKKIMELKSNGKKSASASELKATLEKRSAGPQLAGYATDEYELMVNGKSCGKTYVSAKAGQISDVKRLLEVMDKFDPESMMPEGMAGMMSECDRAQLVTQLEAAGLGLPMKSMDQSGAVEQEIVSILENTQLDAKLFELPAGYERTSPQAMMQDAMSQMQEMMQSITPEQQQMMQQMLQQLGQPGAPQ